MRIGDQVKIIIDTVDPDNVFHGETGEIIDIMFDDAGSVTGDAKDNFMYTVRLSDGTIPDIHFRRSDLVRLEEHQTKLGESPDD